MEICVVGAGVIGLSTAVAIQERMHSRTACRITIMADKFDQHTTSHGSGGHIVPFTPPSIPEHIGREWSKDSEEHFYKLAFSEESSEAGVSLIGGFQLIEKDEKSVENILKALTNVKKMEPTLLRRFGKTMKDGYTATSPLVDLPTYMRWLMSKFLSEGGKVIKKHLESLQELAGQFDVAVNCTGLGSSTLVNDPLMRPVRGQVVRVKAPWIKTFVRADAYLHVFPFADSVFIGSVKQNNNGDISLSVKDSESIFNIAQEVFPPLKGAQVMWEWVGLRPQRDPPRLEEETIDTQGKQLKVVHNYGHGSFGISLSWGTAVHAAKLVENIVKQQIPPSKL